METYETDIIDKSWHNICNKATENNGLVAALKEKRVLTSDEANAVAKNITSYLVINAILELIKTKQDVMEPFVEALEDTGNEAVASDLKDVLIAKQTELGKRTYSKEFYATKNDRWRPDVDQFVEGENIEAAGQDVNERGSGSRPTANEDSNRSGSRSVRQVIKGKGIVVAGRNINK